MERYSNEFINDVGWSAEWSRESSLVDECMRIKFERKIGRYDDYDIMRTLCRYVCKCYTKEQRGRLFDHMAGVTRRYVLEFGKAVKRANAGYCENPFLGYQIDGVIAEHDARFIIGFDAVNDIVGLVEESLLNGYTQSYNRIHPLRFNV